MPVTGGTPRICGAAFHTSVVVVPTLVGAKPAITGVVPLHVGVVPAASCHRQARQLGDSMHPLDILPHGRGAGQAQGHNGACAVAVHLAYEAAGGVHVPHGSLRGRFIDTTDNSMAV